MAKTTDIDAAVDSFMDSLAYAAPEMYPLHVQTLKSRLYTLLIDPYEGEQVESAWADFPNPDTRIGEQG